MRIAKNKALAPASKESSFNGVNDKLIKDLDKVMDVIEKVEKEDPEIRQNYVDKLKKMQTMREQAEQAKEDAKTEAELDQAITDASMAIEKERFFRKRLYEIDHTPHMNEKTYKKSIAIMQTAKERAVNEYRQKAIPLMDELRKVRCDYQAQAAAINSTLERLDLAANILQSKYPNKTVTRNNMDDVYIPDPDAWRDHAVRFDSYEAYRAATCPDPADKTENPSALWDSVLVSAWAAITKGFPKKVY